ncbi:MAG: hypothetical protein NTU76_00840 [Candidatus Taylorbacteria bacterium]|nr:hypothetical protein [Candidatus Taylorbacteria bacterium]
MQDQDKIKEYLAKLPIDIKNIIYSLDYPKLLQEIVKKNRLLIDQAGKLEIETTLALAGLTQLKDYVDSLSKELGITKEKASEIAHDVDEMIFKNIRESLRKINSEEEESFVDNLEEGIKVPEVSAEPSREEVISGIENPKDLRQKEDSVSISSLKSNNPPEAFATENFKGIEIRKDNLPEISPEAILPVKIPGKIAMETYHQNISPVENIIQSKNSSPVVIPREKIVITEKTKLPEITMTPTIKKVDPYREEIK